MKEIKLYTTLGCHLCEQAEVMIKHLSMIGEVEKVKLILVEIAEDERLVDLYGIRIPVLAAINHDCVYDGEPATNSELAWPFDLDELQVWIADQKE